MNEADLNILLVAVIGGLIVAYTLAKGLIALGVVAIFSLGALFSPVARGVTSAGALRAAGKLALYCVGFTAAAWLSMRSIDLLHFNPDSETFALVGAIALIGTAVRFPQTIRLALLRAWQPGFAEEYERTPLSKRQKLLREWTRLRLGDRLPG